MDTQIIPRGLCQCGCGERTRVPTVTDRKAGTVKGAPVAFRRGHHLRLESRKGSGSHLWKGGRSTAHGYVTVTTPVGRQYEHIVVVEHVLGRKLKSLGKGNPKSEVVHHIDGDKTNNAPSNLLVCTHEYHTALHHRLEQSDAWPEFRPVVRRGFGGATR